MDISIIAALSITYLLFAAWKTGAVLFENWEEIWTGIRKEYPAFVDICGSSAKARGIVLAVWIPCTFFSLAFYLMPKKAYCEIRNRIYRI